MHCNQARLALALEYEVRHSKAQWVGWGGGGGGGGVPSKQSRTATDCSHGPKWENLPHIPSLLPHTMHTSVRGFHLAPPPALYTGNISHKLCTLHGCRKMLETGGGTGGGGGGGGESLYIATYVMLK